MEEGKIRFNPNGYGMQKQYLNFSRDHNHYEN